MKEEYDKNLSLFPHLYTYFNVEIYTLNNVEIVKLCHKS